MADAVTVAQLAAGLRDWAVVVDGQAEALTALDAAIGDSDHGTNMRRGTAAIVAKLDTDEPATVPALFKAVGMTLISKVGGASGPLYGTFFLEAGKASPDAAELTGVELVAALRAGVAGVVARGKAEPGDKTMIDALTPALDALAAGIDAGAPIGDSLADAAAAAASGRDATAPLVARKGRASYLGERSAGHVDPGAASSALLIAALAGAVGDAAAP